MFGIKDNINEESKSEPSKLLNNFNSIQVREFKENKCLHTDGLFKIFTKNDIKTIDNLFECTYKRLEKDYITDKSSKICIKRNVCECIHKSRIRKSFGIFEKEWASMIIFTITRDNSLVCELNLSILDNSKISDISELLLLTDYYYYKR